MSTRPSFFFYDLETSGIDYRRHRIMQFAGQRTDLELNPIGDPVNLLVALSDDVLPDPAAVLITGITPQKTREEGYSEAEFLKILHDEVLTPGTIIVGFNSVRFDDEFMRHTLYRNFYDPYEWHWQDERSRWDLLDVVRMTRALRPEGIEWPVDADGHPTNRLELITALNSLEHTKAHDALSDVYALIALARLIKQKQPRLFEYLLNTRHKHKVNELVSLDSPQPFVYASGRYPKGFHHTTVAYPIAEGSRSGCTVVYDLRHNPNEWANKSVQELKEFRFATRDMRQQPDFIPLPAKELACNKCPAAAPLSVLNNEAQINIGLDTDTVQKHLDILRKTDLAAKLQEVFAKDTEYRKTSDVDGQLYSGFIHDKDKLVMRAVRAAEGNDFHHLKTQLNDSRLQELLLRYKARNYPHKLTSEERLAWEEIRAKRLNADLTTFSQELQRLAAKADENQQFLISELQLWAESIVPVVD